MATIQSMKYKIAIMLKGYENVLIFHFQKKNSFRGKYTWKYGNYLRNVKTLKIIAQKFCGLLRKVELYKYKQ